MFSKQLPGMLERHQISIYFSTIVLAILFAFFIPEKTALSDAINPALAFMLLATFLQMPLSKMSIKSLDWPFLGALLTANFIAVPLFIMVLIPFLPDNPMVVLGVLLVLLSPCIDYVVTFSYLGKADGRLLLLATPVLLLMQMLLLPVYLNIFSDHNISELIHIGPFIQAFLWLIALPFILATGLQKYVFKNQVNGKTRDRLALLPVPATALVLFIVVVSVVPKLGEAGSIVIQLIPLYAIYALVAPILGWLVGRCFRLGSPAGRAIAFSTGTRNSLVILPLALSIPDALPLLPAIIITQMLVELLAEMVYIKLMPKIKYHYHA